MKKTPMGIVSALVLSACVEGADITSEPVTVNFTAAGAKTAVQGFDPTEVRAYVKVDNKQQEVTGAKCKVQGSGYSAALSTPAIVAMPNYGYQSKGVTLTCTYDGKTLSKSFDAVNLSAQNRSTNGGAAGGLLGVLVVAAFEGGRDQSKDAYGYPTLSVVFQ